jgi:hypothetical protein
MTDVGYFRRDCNACEAGATGERISVNASNAVGYSYAFEVVTKAESVFSNCCYAVCFTIILYCGGDIYGSTIFVIIPTISSFVGYLHGFCSGVFDVVINAVDFKIVGGGCGAAQ